MARVKTYKKNIACLESLWNQNIENRLSVVPILEIVSKINEVKFTFLTCNTKEELKYNLNKLKRKPRYGILYLAFHGTPGEIVLDESPVDIETLTVFMGKGFTNWIVHFGSCETIDVERQRISNFIAITGISMVVGYKRDVDWIHSAAVDLLLLDWLHSYKDMRRLWDKFRRNYKDLISITGLKAFHR